MQIIKFAPLALAALAATPAAAETLRDLCADRPGIGSPTCTVDRGHLQAEVGLYSFEHDSQDGVRTDTASIAATELRLGLTDRSELQLQLAPAVTVKTRDPAAGTSRLRGADDLTAAYRHTFGSPDALSFALQPFVTAPTGGDGIGSGAWQYGIVVPVQVSLRDSFALGFTGALAAAPDADGAGHHLSVTAVAGLSRGFGPVSLVAELAATVDDDPAGQTTQEQFGLAASWIPAAWPDVQLDAGLNAGLNHETPDHLAYVGVVRRF